MLFLDFSEADVEMEKPRLDCAGCSETCVGPSRKSSKIEEKNVRCADALSALSFSTKCGQKGPPKEPVWGALGLLLPLWRPTWSPKDAQSPQKG